MSNWKIKGERRKLLVEHFVKLQMSAVEEQLTLYLMDLPDNADIDRVLEDINDSIQSWFCSEPMDENVFNEISNLYDKLVEKHDART
jgi:hypothetical protein